MSPKEIAEKIIKGKEYITSIDTEPRILARAYLELEKEATMLRQQVADAANNENTKLKKSREVLRKACEFYASSDQWNCTKEQLTTYNTIDKDDLGIGDFQFACDVDDDRVGGKKAREALKADDELIGGGE